MKKKIISIILSAAVMLTFAGCENSGTAETTTTAAETTTTAESTAAAETTTLITTTTTEATTTTTAAETTTTEETTAPEETTEVSGNEQPDVGAAIGTGLISNAKTGNGFITYDRELIIEDMVAVGLTEKPLTRETVISDYELYGRNGFTLYNFTMLNTDGVQEYPSSDSTIFISVLTLDGVNYGVTYGTGDKVSFEDVLPYASPNRCVEYWAFADVNTSGQITLIPLIAGSESTGYYLVTPVLKMLGADVEGMTRPEPIGEIYTPTETPAEDEAAQVVVNITSVENSDIITTVNCTIENNYNFPLCLIDSSATLNGSDCSDKITAFFTVPAGGTITDCFYLDELQLAEGDELIVVFSASHDETFESLGSLTYRFVLKKS